MAITSKSPVRLAAIGCALLAFSPAAFAQAVKVDKPKIGIEIQKTPRYAVQGPKEKRDTQKFWIEVEVEFKADQKGGDPNNEFIDEIEVKYFITVTPKNAKDRQGLHDDRSTTGRSSRIRPPTRSPIYLLTISPRSSARTRLRARRTWMSRSRSATRDNWSAGDSTKSPSSKWWNNMSQAEGMVLKKSETPFAPLWFDRYAEEKKN